MRYNIGCGMSVGESWINVDSSPTLYFERIPIVGKLYTKNEKRFPMAVVWGDITKGPLCRENTADAVYCSHMLEHISLNEMRRALKNIHFMMKTGAFFRLIVPSIEIRVNDYMAHRDASRFVRATGLGLENASNKAEERLKRVFSNSRHRWMYDLRSMGAELESAGFVSIRECDFGDCEDPSFSEVEDLGRFYREASGKPDDKEVCIECRK